MGLQSKEDKIIDLLKSIDTQLASQTTILQELYILILNRVIK
jgi:hypothetical protein